MENNDTVQMKDVLRKLRREKDRKQITVAADLQISSGTYSTYENGITPPTEVCIKIAHYFDVTVDYLLGLTNERKPADGSLFNAYATLARLAGEAAPVTTDMVALLQAATRYYRKGAPCGAIPMKALRTYTQGLTEALNAAATNNAPALIEAANIATSAALDMSRMVGEYYSKQANNH